MKLEASHTQKAASGKAKWAHSRLRVIAGESHGSSGGELQEQGCRFA